MAETNIDWKEKATQYSSMCARNGEQIDFLEAEIERLRTAISDNLPGLGAIDDGDWHEHTGDLVLKEEQWNAIVAATRELRVALAGGEATSVCDTGDDDANAD